MFSQTVVLAFIVLLLAVIGMAVGVILSNRRLTGSCGGLSAIPGAERCGVCGRDLNDPAKIDCAKQAPERPTETAVR